MTHSRNYKTLRRLIVPALAGGALAVLAFAPTFGAEPVHSNVPPQSIAVRVAAEPAKELINVEKHLYRHYLDCLVSAIGVKLYAVAVRVGP